MLECVYFFLDNESCASDDSYVSLSPVRQGASYSPCRGNEQTTYRGLQ